MSQQAGHMPDSVRQSRLDEDTGMELGEYIEENRDALEELANGNYPISRVVQALLDRRDRGEI
jgi:hypothetical protein